ncbi:MAG: FlgD Ig-like domain [Thermoleophilia bacterium]|nr:FlgD Ig-like domain [Thermoleophilia bacterium]
MCVAVAMLVAPTGAEAACTAVQRGDTAEAIKVVAGLRAAGSSGWQDAAGVLDRSRRRCTAARFARAVAVATRGAGTPPAGRRVRVVGVDLLSTNVPGGTAWRLDVARIAARLGTARSTGAATVLRAELRSAATGGAALAWSDDPTRAGWDAGRQSAVVAGLAASHDARDAALLDAAVRAYAVPRRMAALAALPLLEHLRIANRVAAARADAGSLAARRTARALGARALLRARAARARGWSKVDGHWATLAEHRTLVAQSRALVTRVPSPAARAAVTALERTLVVAPAVAFGALPVEPFYPWPRDGAFDSQGVGLVVDKPASITLSIYAADGRVVRTVAATVDPGPGSIAWDGAGSDGAAVAPDAYRYAIDATDPAGNHMRVPGLEEFHVARDTDVPVVRSATARLVEAGHVRRIVAGWDVDEVHSPNVRSWLLLVSGSDHRSIALHTTLQQATVRRVVDLPKGTWSTAFVFLDGSGNRTSRRVAPIVVR